MRKKKKSEDEDMAVADQAAIEEAEAEMEASPEKVDELLEGAGADTVKRPELKGEAKKPKFEQPGTNNQSSVDIGKESEND